MWNFLNSYLLYHFNTLDGSWFYFQNMNFLNKKKFSNLLFVKLQSNNLLIFWKINNLLQIYFSGYLFTAFSRNLNTSHQLNEIDSKIENGKDYLDKSTEISFIIWIDLKLNCYNKSTEVFYQFNSFIFILNYIKQKYNSRNFRYLSLEIIWYN